MDSDGPREACTRCGPDPHAKGQFLGERTCPGMPDDIVVSCAKMAEQIEMPFGLWTRGPKEACVTWGCTLAPPGEYE